jgi:hypothetical protein
MELQVIEFLEAQLNHKIGRKPLFVPVDRFIQISGSHAIQASQVFIQDNFSAIDQQYLLFDHINWYEQSHLCSPLLRKPRHVDLIGSSIMFLVLDARIGQMAEKRKDFG